MSSNTSSSDEESSTSVTSSSTVQFPTRRKDYLNAFQKEIIDDEVTKKKLKDSKAKCKILKLNVMDTLSRLSREHQEQKRKLDECEAKLETIKAPGRSDQGTEWWSLPYQVVPLNKQTL